METPSIQRINTHDNYHEYHGKGISAKENTNKDKIAEPKKTKDYKAKNEKEINDRREESQRSRAVTLPVDTRISYSVENDLNLVVTRVVDANTKKVIRQIPPEEVIKRIRLLKNYHQPVSTAKGSFVNDVIE